jgi:4-amino-4-deoxy-L-arabinose transferase-like glycosyltransferase
VAWLAAGLLLRPFQNTPFIDDWVYAWPVERLLKGGDLRVLDYSTSLNAVQVLWGALFCLPFGFSFTALRVATWAMGLLGLWGMYLLLRDQGVTRRDALLGTACLGAYPIYFVLSFSFLTDVPFVTCAIWATLAFLRATRRRSDRWLWMAVGVSCAAVGIRVVGAVLPSAMVLALLVDREGWGWRKARFLWPAPALVFLVAMVWWFQRHVEVVGLTGVSNSPESRIRLLKEYGLQFLPMMSVCATTFLAGALGLALLPVSVGVMSRRRLTVALIVMVVLCAGVATALSGGQSHAPPLTPGQTWWPGELGATEPLVPDYAEPAASAGWVWLVTAVTLASASVLVERSVRRLDTPDTFLLLQVFGQLLLIALLWLFYDRYALVLVPVALVLTLRGGPILRPRITGALVIVMGLVSLVGVRDHLEYNRALWTAVAHLETIGIAPADFDGGYVVNGWLQYAHPERARRDPTGAVQVPGVNVSTTTLYRISNRARPGWMVVASVPYTRWATRSGRVYVLEQPRRPGSGTPE